MIPIERFWVFMLQEPARLPAAFSYQGTLNELSEY